MDAASGAPADLEADSRFPSGPWTGYFLQPPDSRRHWMDLGLTFRQGTVRGSGRDWVGEFVVMGRYDLEGGKCFWTKRYLGQHEVAYQGYAEEKGIWGTWEIPPFSRGGFHIWPKGMGGAPDAETEQAVPEPQLAVKS
jgi:hypothetical protein